MGGEHALRHPWRKWSLLIGSLVLITAVPVWVSFEPGGDRSSASPSVTSSRTSEPGHQSTAPSSRITTPAVRTYQAMPTASVTATSSPTASTFTVTPSAVPEPSGTVPGTGTSEPAPQTATSAPEPSRTSSPPAEPRGVPSHTASPSPSPTPSPSATCIRVPVLGCLPQCPWPLCKHLITASPSVSASQSRRHCCRRGMV